MVHSAQHSLNLLHPVKHRSVIGVVKCVGDLIDRDVSFLIGYEGDNLPRYDVFHLTPGAEDFLSADVEFLGDYSHEFADDHDAVE